MTPTSIRRDALAIGLATGAYAISYGVLAVASGLSVAKTCAMSLLVFTGASQFAVVGVLGAGAASPPRSRPRCCSPRATRSTACRSCPCCAGASGPARAQSQLIIDESTAMARAQQDPVLAHRAFLLTGLSVFVFWNIGTLAGALLGSGLGDPRALGLDAMFPAAFLALLAPQLTTPAARTAAVCGGLLAIALVPFVPVGVPVLAAALGVIPGVLAMHRAARTAA